ncbi:MAG TPA: SH3 domain-containing protein [Vicinamibacteria bacterium]|nr:SH3 domain-containing protein [Vicinamibacteria bacterium]
MFRRTAVALGALAILACASAPQSKVDLQPARTAVQKAREAGAARKAPEDLALAEGHLKAAESAAAQPEQADKAACLSELAAYEADCALRLTTVEAQAERLPAAEKGAAEAEQLQDRLKRAEEDYRRLEERVAVLTRDLDLTETEVIRTKAKLQGLETKADATSVIAETRVLFRRALQQRGRTPSLLRCEELLDRAEAMVEANNHGAAVFMALKVQELLKDTRRSFSATASEDGGDRPAPKRQYTVTAEFANLRTEPSRSGAVVQRIKKGTLLEATRQRGDWLQVQVGDATGWIARALVE